MGMATTTQPISRRAVRIYLKMPVAICVDSDRSRVHHRASTIDLSSHGARVRTNAGLVSGQGVTIIADRIGRRSIPSRVAWVGPVGSRLEGLAGIEFLHPISVPS